MGTGATLRKDILITITGMAEITTMVTERTTIMGMELTQRKVDTNKKLNLMFFITYYQVTGVIMTTTRRKATTMAATTTTTTVRLQRRENRRKNKVRAAALLLMAAANKEGTNSRRGYTPSAAGLNTEQGNYECVCLLYYWQQHNNTLGSRGYNSSSVGAGVAVNLL